MRVEDMLEAVGRIDRYISGLTFDDFAPDQKTFDAVVRNLEVIGEAARKIPDEARQIASDVAWNDIGDMRNVLAYEYFGVDAAIVWKTVTDDLPILARRLREMLGTP